MFSKSMLVCQSLATLVPGKARETRTSNRDLCPLPRCSHIRIEAGEGRSKPRRCPVENLNQEDAQVQPTPVQTDTQGRQNCRLWWRGSSLEYVYSEGSFSIEKILIYGLHIDRPWALTLIWGKSATWLRYDIPDEFVLKRSPHLNRHFST